MFGENEEKCSLAAASCDVKAAPSSMVLICFLMRVFVKMRKTVGASARVRSKPHPPTPPQLPTPPSTKNFYARGATDQSFQVFTIGFHN